jgi:hypothetical protein
LRTLFFDYVIFFLISTNKTIVSHDSTKKKKKKAMFYKVFEVNIKMGMKDAKLEQRFNINP